jgi:hypothetical protein
VDWLDRSKFGIEPPTPDFKDIRALIADFAQHMQSLWRNTRSLCKSLNEPIDTDLDIDSALAGLALPSVHEVGVAEYANQLVIQLLDRAFIMSLRTRFPSLALEIGDTDASTHQGIFASFSGLSSTCTILLRYVYTEFHFTDFMSAVAHWRKDRRGNPTIIYPEVLTILHGKEHDCTECALSGRCQPEHACCRAYLLDHFVAIGWATNHRMDGIQLTDYYGKMAYLLTTNGGGGKGGWGGGGASLLHSPPPFPVYEPLH